ncbi:hypothetical protein ACQPZ2_22310 [Nocardia pseudovaccinii]|uniref:hypothetical protein n=1 Tax=Nocardia pseudovaccinii TaxID=189540 RepID=UPI003D8A4AE7
MTSVRSDRATPDVVVADAIEHLRRDFPAVSADVLHAAAARARHDLCNAPASWLPELAERLAWWRLVTASGAFRRWSPLHSAATTS